MRGSCKRQACGVGCKFVRTNVFAPNDDYSLLTSAPHSSSTHVQVGTLEEIIDDQHAIVGSAIGPEHYVNILSFVDKDELEPNCSVLLHSKVCPSNHPPTASQQTSRKHELHRQPSRTKPRTTLLHNKPQPLTQTSHAGSHTNLSNRISLPPQTMSIVSILNDFSRKPLAQTSRKHLKPNHSHRRRCPSWVSSTTTRTLW